MQRDRGQHYFNNGVCHIYPSGQKVVAESRLVSLRGTLVPAKTLNTLLSKIPLVGTILIGKKDGEGLFGVSFKIKGLPNELKTTVNPVKTLTPRFITRALEALKKQQIK